MNGSCTENPREFFICDSDYRITFSVFETDVVAGAVFLDQIIFKNQCFVLICRNNVFNAYGIGNEKLGFYVFLT